jgi:dolichol-phosphate mannosyltransferase
MTAPARPLISIVVPVLNEEDNIRRLYDRVCEVMGAMDGRYRWELVVTDNHSTDRSFELLAELAAADRRVRVIRFSKNFGYQRSILTGYLTAAGDAVVQLDCDMQDPPELIQQMLADWEKGWKVVYGVRRTRSEGVLMTATRKFFYRGINWLSEEPLPLDAGDFRLIDRRVVEEIRKVEDANPYLRGLIATLGFPQKGFEYDRAARAAGRSKFPLRALVRIALDGVLNHTTLPLRVATYASAFMVLAAFCLGGLYVTLRLTGLGEAWPPGFATLVTLVLLSTALNALFFGLQGEYIGRIFQQVKRRPLTIVERELKSVPGTTTPGAANTERAA